MVIVRGHTEDRGDDAHQLGVAGLRCLGRLDLLIQGQKMSGVMK